MQTKEQWKRNWKVIAATTAVSALGLGGAAIADSRDNSAAPAPISLSERANIKAVTNLPLVGSIGADQSADLDSPFDDFSQQTGDDSPDSPTSPSTFDSPDSPASVDSPDLAPSTQADSPASVDSPADDSPASVDSPASASADS